MRQWRPTVEEERWLETLDALGGNLDRDALTGRTGGWRSTGLLARIALFVLGCVAAGLIFGILTVGSAIEPALFVAGALSLLVAEWLHVARRFHGSGIEEGLCVAGSLMIGFWMLTFIPGWAAGPTSTLVLVAATALAGIRLLNPVVVAGAALAFVWWVDVTPIAHAFDQAIGRGMTAFLGGCALAAMALFLGAKQYRRPSHDRMLDWMVATLPIVAYSQRAAVESFEASASAVAIGAGRIVTVAVLLALAGAMLAAGLRRRRHAPLIGFLGCMVGAAIEIRLATSWPTEAWLILYGLVALGAGLAIDRFLRQPRNGLTSAALKQREGPVDLLQMAGAAALAQRSAPGPSYVEPEPELTSGEGRFGGGGASGRF